MIDDDDDAPEVDALPVLAEPTTIVSQREPAPVAMQAAVVAVEPHHLGKAHRVAVELQRAFEIGDLQRHMANAGQSKLRHFVLRRDDYKPGQL